MMEIRFRVEGKAQTKGSAKGFVGRSKTTGKLRAFIVNDNTANKSWAKTVAVEAARHRPSTLLTGPIGVQYLFIRKRPHRPRCPCPITKPDLDKLVRSLNDALTGIIWKDDAQVIQSSESKVYGDHEAVEIVITAISTPGEDHT